MTTSKQDDFNITFGDEDEDIEGESPEAYMKQEADGLKIERLNLKVTIMSLVIPCLVFAVLILGYMDMKKRATEIHVSGAQGVKKLSDAIDARVAKMSLRFSKADKDHDDKLTALTADSAARKRDVAGIRKNVKKIDTDKAGKKTTSRSIGKVSSKVDTLKKATDKKLATLDAEFSADVAALVRKQDSLKAGIKDAEKNMVSTASLEHLLDLERLESTKKFLKMKARMDDLSAGLEELDALRQEVKALKKEQAALKKRLKGQSGSQSKGTSTNKPGNVKKGNTSTSNAPSGTTTKDSPAADSKPATSGDSGDPVKPKTNNGITETDLSQ